MTAIAAIALDYDNISMTTRDDEYVYMAGHAQNFAAIVEDVM